MEEFIKKGKKINLFVLIVSLIIVILIPFLLGFRESASVIYEYRENPGDKYFGFPFDWLVLYPNNGYSFLGIGFIINVILFYFVIKFLVRLYTKLTKN